MDRRAEITQYYKELDHAYFMEFYKEQAHKDTPFPSDMVRPYPNRA